ncbi:hypothetical protein FDP41_006286 [Naegleria fowleri]|uniref:RRM domain-containing protein n=1 Tax=Naegleria fowleri TaxID=5763 RepID=A0A6A5BIX9_NAEFO|nr:uncharacterized protein FDP41_006286 [Naegleria fowleri]KAF0974812.1 hypothetical protein FDP41_006286 [Naegleria fowleri]CAG4718111.1 unnamed protein product [Naegleria fowleri]
MAHLIEAAHRPPKHLFFYGSKREYDYLLKHYVNEGGNEEDFEKALSQSSTIYVENLSFYTKEEQIYELFEKCGEVKRVIMGLNRNTHTPCGFCFVEFYHRSDAEDCVKYCRGCKLNNRALKIAIDTGFFEGRQYGRGKDGGMKRDDYQKMLKKRGGARGRGSRGGGSYHDSSYPSSDNYSHSRGSSSYYSDRGDRGNYGYSRDGVPPSTDYHARHPPSNVDGYDASSPVTATSSYSDSPSSHPPSSAGRYGPPPRSTSPTYGPRTSTPPQRGSSGRSYSYSNNNRYQPYPSPVRHDSPPPQPHSIPPPYYGRIPPPYYGHPPTYGGPPPSVPIEIPPPRAQSTYGRSGPYINNRPQYGNYGRTTDKPSDKSTSRDHFENRPRESRDYGPQYGRNTR